MNADSGNFSLSAFKRNTAGMVDTNTVLNRTLKTAVYGFRNVRPCAHLGDLFTPPGCKLKGASLIPEYWLYVIINEKLSDKINPLLHQYNDVSIMTYQPAYLGYSFLQKVFKLWNNSTFQQHKNKEGKTYSLV